MDPKESATDTAKNLREAEEQLRRSRELLDQLVKQIEKSRQIIESLPPRQQL